MEEASDITLDGHPIADMTCRPAIPRVVGVSFAVSVPHRLLVVCTLYGKVPWLHVHSLGSDFLVKRHSFALPRPVYYIEPGTLPLGDGDMMDFITGGALVVAGANCVGVIDVGTGAHVEFVVPPGGRSISSVAGGTCSVNPYVAVESRGCVWLFQRLDDVWAPLHCLDFSGDRHRLDFSGQYAGVVRCMRFAKDDATIGILVDKQPFGLHDEGQLFICSTRAGPKGPTGTCVARTDRLRDHPAWVLEEDDSPGDWLLWSNKRLERTKWNRFGPKSMFERHSDTYLRLATVCQWRAEPTCVWRLPEGLLMTERQGRRLDRVVVLVTTQEEALMLAMICARVDWMAAVARAIGRGG